MMTREQYRDWYYHQMLINNSGCGTPLMLCLVIVIVATMLCSCRSIQYVPVETVKTERVEVHDTVTVADSTARSDSTATNTKMLLQKVDSAYLALLGVINAPQEAWLLQYEKETTQKTSESVSHKESEKQSSDSVRIEYKDRPFPVEKQLTRWQSFCIDYGKIMLGMTVASIAVIVVLVILWRRKKR